MTKTKFSSCLGLLLCVVLLAACGRKTAPAPDFSALTFTLRSASVMQDGSRLLVQGSVAGAAQNAESVVLELQPLDENCADCPFVPEERVRMEAEEVWESPDGSTFAFRCLPQTHASSYRWRLSVHNITSGIAPQISPLGVVDFDAGKDDSGLQNLLTAPSGREERE